MKPPTIVCLCGSTRFYKEFTEANYRLTMAGRIVLSVGFYPHATQEMHGESVGITPEQKEALDQLHLRKIDLADEILVLNVDGYIGESTAREIDYAEKLDKPVRYLDYSRMATEASTSLTKENVYKLSLCVCISNSGPNREPLACGYPAGHDGPHSWGTLPTFTPGLVSS